MQDVSSFTTPSTGQPEETNAAAGSSAGGGIKYELYWSPSQGQQNEAAAVSELENRIALLEKQLGENVSEPAHADVMVNGVVPTIAKLEGQLKALDPAYMDGIIRRVDHLNTELDSVTKKAGGQLKALDPTLLKEGSHAKKVDQLFEKMQRVDAVAPSLEGLLARLQDLKGLHEESANFSQRLNQVESGQADVTQLLKTDTELLSEVKGSLAENMATIQANVASIDKRMEEIAAKMGK
jgi:hypothetical protein